MAHKIFFKCNHLSLAHQKASLCKTFRHSECNIFRNKLIWKSRIRPTPLSREYSVEVQYSMIDIPQVYIYGDELKKLDNSNFPHNYGIDASKKRVKICLYRYNEFSSDMLLSATIIPWTIEWLFFYEIWLATGIWQGGGEHPKKHNSF